MYADNMTFKRWHTAAAQVSAPLRDRYTSLYATHRTSIAAVTDGEI
jgi:hypothetical protein